VRGPTVIKEYYGRPEANAKAFKDGWYRTGDIGKLDADGYLTVVDRKTDMVISGGRHPAVRQVTTFGVPDDRLGERLVAGFVVDGRIASEDLMDYAKDNLAAYNPLSLMPWVKLKNIKFARLISPAKGKSRPHNGLS